MLATQRLLRRLRPAIALACALRPGASGPRESKQASRPAVTDALPLC